MPLGTNVRLLKLVQLAWERWKVKAGCWSRCRQRSGQKRPTYRSCIPEGNCKPGSRSASMGLGGGLTKRKDIPTPGLTECGCHSRLSLCWMGGQQRIWWTGQPGEGVSQARLFISLLYCPLNQGGAWGLPSHWTCKEVKVHQGWVTCPMWPDTNFKLT